MRMSMRNIEEEFSRRKAGLPSAIPKTPQEELAEALRDHLYREYHDMPYPARRDARWVMNAEWWDEVTGMARAMGAPPQLAPPVTLFGKPVDVREDGGVPHLEHGP